jgi:hypothetical protein
MGENKFLYPHSYGSIMKDLDPTSRLMKHNYENKSCDVVDKGKGVNRECYYEYKNNTAYCPDDRLYMGVEQLFNSIKDNFINYIMYDMANLCSVDDKEITEFREEEVTTGKKQRGGETMPSHAMKIISDTKFNKISDELILQAHQQINTCFILFVNDFMDKSGNIRKKIDEANVFSNMQVIYTKTEDRNADECDDKALLLLMLLLTSYKQNRCVTIYSNDNYASIQHHGAKNENKIKNRMLPGNHPEFRRFLGSSVFYEEVVPYFYKNYSDEYNYLVTEFANKQKMVPRININILEDRHMGAAAASPIIKKIIFISLDYIIIKRFNITFNLKINEQYFKRMLSQDIHGYELTRACGYDDMNNIIEKIKAMMKAEEIQEMKIYEYEPIEKITIFFNYVRCNLTKYIQSLDPTSGHYIHTRKKIDEWDKIITMTDYEKEQYEFNKYARGLIGSNQKKYLKYKTKYLNLLKTLKINN